MIDCRKCGFSIKASMRHALVENCCPACGSAIMGDTHTQRMRLMKQRLMSQEFSQALSDELIFDISLFMLLEFTPISSGDDEDSESTEAQENKENSTTEDSDDYEKIRDEIREEVLAKTPDSPEELEEDLKIARLKRLAKESKIKKSGTAVRRISND